MLAYGAVNDKKLGLAGEDKLAGVYSSRRVVNWYNGSLDNDLSEEELALDKVRDV